MNRRSEQFQGTVCRVHCREKQRFRGGVLEAFCSNSLYSDSDIASASASAVQCSGQEPKSGADLSNIILFCLHNTLWCNGVVLLLYLYTLCCNGAVLLQYLYSVTV